ncbi:MAG TPA: hypothetical protein VFU88_17500 [Ktedonobacterales bacterium]|nr:hypothetical protein [Ktedonobacterales bacterium]
MRSRVVGPRHLRKVALVLVAGCLVSFAAGQTVGHFALPEPPLASLAARADAPVATAIAGAISKVQRPTAQQPVTHKPTSKPTSGHKTHSQPKAKKTSHPRTKHKPKGHDHQGKQGHSGGKGKSDQPSPAESSADQPTTSALPTSGAEGGSDTLAAPGPERLPPESTGGV